MPRVDSGTPASQSTCWNRCPPFLSPALFALSAAAKRVYSLVLLIESHICAVAYKYLIIQFQVYNNVIFICFSLNYIINLDSKPLFNAWTSENMSSHGAWCQNFSVRTLLSPVALLGSHPPASCTQCVSWSLLVWMTSSFLPYFLHLIPDGLIGLKNHCLISSTWNTAWQAGGNK